MHPKVNTEDRKRIYAEKLKDPRWLTKRYGILHRDKAKCQYCGSNERLEVHHKKYTGEPWDAPDEDLITACHFCHRIIEDLKTYLTTKDDPLLSIQKLQGPTSNGMSKSYYFALVQTSDGGQLVLIYEFRGESFDVIFWSDAYELYDVIRVFKSIKSNSINGKRPCNPMVLE